MFVNHNYVCLQNMFLVIIEYLAESLGDAFNKETQEAWSRALDILFVIIEKL